MNSQVFLFQSKFKVDLLRKNILFLSDTTNLNQDHLSPIKTINSYLKRSDGCTIILFVVALTFISFYIHNLCCMWQILTIYVTSMIFIAEAYEMLPLFMLLHHLVNYLS